MDFDSDDELETVAKGDLAPAFEAGHLKLFKRSALRHWNAIIAKNTSHCTVEAWG